MFTKTKRNLSIAYKSSKVNKLIFIKTFEDPLTLSHGFYY